VEACGEGTNAPEARALATTLATKLGQFFPALATLDGLEGKQRAEAEAIATTAAPPRLRRARVSLNSCTASAGGMARS
jgi:hypothetical protein